MLKAPCESTDAPVSGFKSPLARLWRRASIAK